MIQPADYKFNKLFISRQVIFAVWTQSLNLLYRKLVGRFNGSMDKFDASWDKWKVEQVQTITQILSHVFKVEDEARQMQAPSRLLRRSSLDSPEAEAEMRNKLSQIREQISEYEAVLKMGRDRIEQALGKIEPQSSDSVAETQKTVSLMSRIKSFFQPKTQ